MQHERFPQRRRQRGNLLLDFRFRREVQHGLIEFRFSPRGRFPNFPKSPTGVDVPAADQCTGFWRAGEATLPNGKFSQRRLEGGLAPLTSPGSRRPPHPPHDRPFPGDKAGEDLFDGGSTSTKKHPTCQRPGQPAGPHPASPTQPHHQAGVFHVPRISWNCHSCAINVATATMGRQRASTAAKSIKQKTFTLRLCNFWVKTIGGIYSWFNNFRGWSRRIKARIGGRKLSSRTSGPSPGRNIRPSSPRTESRTQSVL